MKSIIWFGIFIAVLAIIGLTVPVFTTWHTRDVASVGDVKLQSTTQSTHVVPVALSVGGLALGLALIGLGVYSRHFA